jgi:type I restriction-modification system DNA methylase subunit
MLFQKNILRKYLALLPAERIDAAWSTFQSYFLNADIQQNILQSKEEQFQEGFLRELFVKMLGYTLNPSPNFNLITEQKNETNSKKADGAILIDGKVVGIIELKDHKTPDLSKVETQAFGYKNQHPDARLVVISNFEKLRLYIDNTVEHIEWNLFTLKEQEFREMYLCLAFEQVKQETALKMKQESVSSEDQITKALYKDYSQFKRALFADIVAQNPDYDQLLLFKKTQKLLDRLLFIFFAEDCGLLPPNSMMQIINWWEEMNDHGDYFPFYERIKKYFGYMNTGFQGKKYEIFAYNGGLFKPDEVLDNITISDAVLVEHTKRLSEYDFESEVDVNILGHIFENSLSEIEEMTQQIEAGLSSSPSGEAGRGLVSKRKQDGVFYTPQYITKYIVENTVGRLCAEKKQELGIDEAEYFADAHRQKQTKIRLLDKLTQYRDWLKQITILDPACGSGAFLNAALRFLIDEHHKIDVMEAKVTESTFVYPDIDKEILEHNLFGVDINEESVEIAQLALWLRTAQPRRKLNTLNQNIKCGNSLISDPAIAGEKAFNWQEEFPQVFEKGGFDVVIGNPPYVFAREKVSEEEKNYYTYKYESAKYQVNTYIIFMEQALLLARKNAVIGLIVPNSWLMTYSGEALRKLFIEKASVDKIVNLYGKSFEDASVETVITIIENKESRSDQEIEILKVNENSKSFDFLHSKMQKDFSKNKGYEFLVFQDDESESIIEKIQQDCKGLDEVACVKAGLQAYEKGKGIPKQSAEDVKSRPYDYTYKYNEDTYKYLDGSNVLRYAFTWTGQWLWYGNHLAAPRTINLFTDEKIVVREITSEFPHCLNAVYIRDTYLYNRSNIAIIKREGVDISLKFILVLLNSTLLSFYFKKNTAKAERKLFPKIILNDLRLFPIKAIPLVDQQPFIALADKMLSLNKDLQEKRSRFLRRLGENIEGVKITTALQTFDELDFAGFVAELKKQKIKLSLSQQDEWEPYFNQNKEACQALAQQISETDKEIDTRVFDLYGLTPEEREIVMKG